MIVVVDNRDSFTFNLVQELQVLGAEVRVVRGLDVSAAEILALAPLGILIGPGPGEPSGAGCSEDLVRAAAAETAVPPVLGICLGHQCLATALGGSLQRAQELVHGATRAITHDGQGVLEGLPSPFEMARYNSLAVEESTLPRELTVTARTADGEIAGLRHRTHALESVQGHPESILCADGERGGRRLFANFIERCAASQQKPAC